MTITDKFFVVVYPQDPEIKPLLDGIKAVADPSQKSLAHITVKGPYKGTSRYEQKKHFAEYNKQIRGKKLKIEGISNFFKDNQNTVFFKCDDSEKLRRIWNEQGRKTYKEFHPHITIYDGNDRSFANRLFNTINNHGIDFSFYMNNLDIYTSSKYQSSWLILKNQLDYPLLSRISDFRLNEYSIDQLTEEQRLNIINKLCAALKEQTSKQIPSSRLSLSTRLSV